MAYYPIRGVSSPLQASDWLHKCPSLYRVVDDDNIFTESSCMESQAPHRIDSLTEYVNENDASSNVEFILPPQRVDTSMHHQFEMGDRKRSSMKKRLQKRAPGAPKRSKSPYIMFSMDKRAEVKARYPPKTSVTEIMKALAELWSTLSPAEKVPYQVLAEQDKRRYEMEMANYDGPIKVPNKRNKKHPNAPKRSACAFLYYSQVVRPKIKNQFPDMKNIDISKELGKQWREASDEMKAPFIAREAADRDRYRKEMIVWNSGAKEREAQEQIMLREQWRLQTHQHEMEAQALHQEALLARTMAQEQGDSDHNLHYYHNNNNMGRYSAPYSKNVGEAGEEFSNENSAHYNSGSNSFLHRSY